MPADGKNPEKWSSEDKFAIVLEAAALNEAELAEYCREKGLHVEQIEAWRKACLAEGITARPLVLHSDNGSPMKGATMLETLRRLGVDRVVVPDLQVSAEPRRSAPYRRGHGDTGTPGASVPGGPGSSPQPLEWRDQEPGAAGAGLAESGERTV